MQAPTSDDRGQDFPPGFNPVESAARLLRNPTVDWLVGLVIICVLYSVSRSKTSALVAALDRAPIDDEPVTEWERTILEKPIDYTDTMTASELREQLRSDRAMRA